MKNLMNELPNTLLLGAGPSNIAPATYHALAAPILGHMHPYFIKVMDGVKEFLQQLMNTDNQLTVPLSTSGSGGMAAAFANSVEPGDPVLILQNGVFSERMSEMARRLEADLTVLEFPWGEPVRTEVVEAELKKRHYKVVGMIYGETSTGVLNPVPEIGSLLKDTDTIFLVDAVPTMGGCPLMVDQWGMLFRIPEMPFLPSRPGSHHLLPQSHGYDEQTQKTSRRLVYGCFPADGLLGRHQARLSSYRAH